MKKILPFAIILTFLISFVFVDNEAANAGGTSVIQSVAKDTAIYEDPSVESTEIGQITKGSYVTATPVSKKWTQIKVQQLEGYVETAALVSTTPEIYLVTQKGGTSLFTYPSPNAQKTGLLNENSIIFVYGSAPGGWSFVQYGHQTGYVATNSLKKPVATTKRVNAANGAMLRLTASPNGEILGTIANKTVVQQYTTLVGWAYVEAGEQKGYVKASELANIQIPGNKIYNKGVPVAKGEKKRVALTFDDGPDAKVTPQILATLKKYNAKATFFMVGPNASKNSAIVKNVYEAGHELGNHTWNHPKLTGLSPANVKQEVDRTSNAIYASIGQYPTVFRPPYGAVNDKVRSVITMPSILWSIDTLDWKHHNADKILASVKASVKDGSIVLMHDIHQTTANGLESVILYLQKQGYEFVTVSEILQ
ncbi:deacetylase [Lysinibacillus sp. KCTC 33748]|uniref:polysaccharide deacetylase family protein n=1 Tax=unclassified Lysinibacillus TaxID=2636778 RepID=UPI0009A907B0|nr:MULTISPECIES: polysaccharide deacetylase family protein [unclassified Lysinibacillus]OXS74438.1 deacetylase [Lysinibacillus sp. KCTC 33748]SKB66693.1 Peptidoglycan/xylan/chitin deacetylase, PgdA/CDA1 family [Lysinibacillus sp. AC-3]